MKIFFDTNVYIGRALTGGAAREAINVVLRAGWRVIVSDYVLNEVERILTDRLGRARRDAKLVRRQIEGDSRIVRISSSRHRVPRDANDDPILVAALESGADYLVSNDRDLLELDPYEGLRIVSMQDFLAVLREHGLLRR